MARGFHVRNNEEGRFPNQGMRYVSDRAQMPRGCMYVPDPTSNPEVSYVFGTIMTPSVARIFRLGRCGSDIELLGEIRLRPLVHTPSKEMAPPVLRALLGKDTATRVQ